MLNRIPQRYWLVLMCFFATFICYMDRVNISVAIIAMAEDHQWDLTTQGTILSSFFVGYLILQIVGGQLADRFGGKVVLGIGVLSWSLFTILTPPAAAMSVTALIATRILMGMGEAVTFPSIYSLYAKWVPLPERTRSIAFANSGIPLGTVVALVATPIIVQAYGWPWAFYSFGLVGVIWVLVWHRSVTATPATHPNLSEQERQLVSFEESKERIPTPWKALLTKMPVWAIVVAHFCNNWSSYVLMSWLPTYITKGLGVDYASVGWYTMIPSIASFFFLNIAGVAADRMIRGGLEVGRVRKICHSIGALGTAIALFVVGYVTNAEAAIAIMTVGAIIGAFVTGGFASNHMDIAPKHAGTLMGITNTAGTVPGIIGVSVSGMILDATGSWILVFQVAAAVTVFGWLFFVAFASGKKLVD